MRYVEGRIVVDAIRYLCCVGVARHSSMTNHSVKLRAANNCRQIPTSRDALLIYASHQLSE